MSEHFSKNLPFASSDEVEEVVEAPAAEVAAPVTAASPADPLDAEVQLLVTAEFQSDDDNAKVDVSVGSLNVVLNAAAGASPVTVSERDARVLEDSPAVERVGVAA